MMKHLCVASACVIATVSAPAQAAVPHPDVVAQATRLCVEAISPTRFDEDGFRKAGWAEQRIAAAPEDRFYVKDGLRASLGLRPSVGGSCIISYAVPADYDLAALTAGLAHALGAEASLGALRLPGKIVLLQMQPVPTGTYVTIDVEVLG